jgi:hypothetical protein
MCCSFISAGTVHTQYTQIWILIFTSFKLLQEKNLSIKMLTAITIKKDVECKYRVQLFSRKRIDLVAWWT